MDMGLFHVVAIMNYAAVNIHVKVFMGTYVFLSFGEVLRSGMAQF